MADIPCPPMPDAVTQVNRNIKSDINASVGSIGKVKAGDVGIKTEVEALNLFGKYPSVDKLLTLQTMSATYCQMLRSSKISDTEKLDRWERFQEKRFAIEPLSSPPQKLTSPTQATASGSSPNASSRSKTLSQALLQKRTAISPTSKDSSIRSFTHKSVIKATKLELVGAMVI